MPATWVSKEKIQTIWGMLHNMRIRMQENIKTPSITATGTGLQASINIALPKLGSESGELALPMPVVDITDYDVEEGEEVVYKIQVQTAYEDINDIIEYPGGYLSVGKSAETELEEDGFVYYDFPFDPETGSVSGPDVDFTEEQYEIQSDLAEGAFHCLLASVSIVEGRLVIRRRKFDNFLPIVGC